MSAKRSKEKWEKTMGTFLSERELSELTAPDNTTFPSPVPLQMVSNGEFNPLPQTEEQRKVEGRLKELADEHGRRLGFDRRRFLRSSCGMAAAFVAMNDVFGRVFNVDPAEAREPEVGAARAEALSKQFIFDDQLHFVRDDYGWEGILGIGQYAAENWNPALKSSLGMGMDRIKFENFVKEVYLDSDTTVGLLSGAPFDDPNKWFLTSDQIKAAADDVNGLAGTKRLLYHSMITPKQPGWMDAVDHAIEVLHPTSWKSYTIGDPLSPATTKYPWRLDDEKLMYPFYEKAVKAGITTLCIHKGLLPKDYETSIPGGGWRYATVDDVGKAAKDWPQMNFVIYHSALRAFVENPVDDLAEFERTGYVRWTSDLAAIPDKFGVTNVYAELGTCLAVSVVTNPRFCAAFMGTLIKGLGYDHVLWGTDSVFYGSPQWQIEAFRRLEIPDDMQKKHGFAPLGAADGPVKSAILGFNGARHYHLDLRAAMNDMPFDGIAKQKAAYLQNGGNPSNAAYGYVVKAG
jgi:predicted TIM-barrel fold metal-dependent hydrolase